MANYDVVKQQNVMTFISFDKPFTSLQYVYIYIYILEYYVLEVIDSIKRSPVLMNRQFEVNIPSVETYFKV